MKLAKQQDRKVKTTVKETRLESGEARKRTKLGKERGLERNGAEKETGCESDKERKLIKHT
jgi:hypothetical protein